MLKNEILLSLFLLCGLFAACQKTPPYDVEKQLDRDALIIAKYVKDNNLDSVIVDSSGLNYRFIEKGTGTVFPKLSDSIVVSFEARLLGASAAFQTVAQTDSVTVKLADAMQGWRIGLPKITKGGQIRLIIPSGLAYKDFGSPGGSPIPPFAILDYTIRLKNIK